MENNRIKLSLCIPTYNRSDALEILLESIYRQIGNHKDEVEVCISDNASTDDTEEIVKKYIGKFDLKYDKKENPIHPILNWNNAIDILPSGEYVLMVGDDDVFINNAIERMLDMIQQYPSDYYYLNHIHAQVNVNKDKVYNHNCVMEYRNDECECQNQTSRYIDKWEEIFNFISGDYQEMNMLFIGNHLMKRGMWHADVDKFERLFNDYIRNKQPLCEETKEYFYSIWSPHVTIIANVMMGKRCYYCDEPMISQGMGINASDIFQIYLLLFMPRDLKMLRDTGMDDTEYRKYYEYVSKQEVKRYVNLLLYKSHLLKQHPYCSDFISLQENTSEILGEIAKKLMDKTNDYYYNMADNHFQNSLSGLLEQKTGRVVLWGTGDVGKNYLDALPALRKHIDFVADGNVRLHGINYEELNLVIHDPQDIQNEQVYMVVIASVRHEKEIEKTLGEYGCKGYYVVKSQGIQYVE